MLVPHDSVHQRCHASRTRFMLCGWRTSDRRWCLSISFVATSFDEGVTLVTSPPSFLFAYAEFSRWFLRRKPSPPGLTCLPGLLSSPPSPSGSIPASSSLNRRSCCRWGAGMTFCRKKRPSDRARPLETTFASSPDSVYTRTRLQTGLTSSETSRQISLRVFHRIIPMTMLSWARFYVWVTL